MHAGRAPGQGTWQGHVGRTRAQCTREADNEGAHAHATKNWHCGRSFDQGTRGHCACEGHAERARVQGTWEGHTGMAPGKGTREWHTAMAHSSGTQACTWEVHLGRARLGSARWQATLQGHVRGARGKGTWEGHLARARGQNARTVHAGSAQRRCACACNQELALRKGTRSGHTWALRLRRTR